MSLTEAQREYQRAYYLKNREKKLAYAREYVAQNYEKVRAAQKGSYNKNPEKYRQRSRENYYADAEAKKAYQSAYRRANPSKVNETNKAWNRAHPENVKAIRDRWRAANLDKWAEKERRRRAVKIGTAVMKITRSILAARWDYYGGLCWMCGKPAVEWDHVKPLARGGAHIPANLRPACRFCNASKRDHWPLEVAV
jgi:5-methylcytosine-specific restriction endonuclease McrA